jgi:hypothetical protein
MPKLIHPHRTVATDGKITYQLRITSDVEAEVTIPAPTNAYPETHITDARYKLADNGTEKEVRRITNTLHWLSGRAPLLTEKVLSYLEGNIPEVHRRSLVKMLGWIAPPIPDCSDALQLSYFQEIIDVSPTLFALATDEWRVNYYPAGFDAYHLFDEMQVAAAGLADSNLYNAVTLAVWITQDFHGLSNPYPAHKRKDDLEFIASRFDEVYNARHELRKLHLIDGDYINTYLEAHKPKTPMRAR